MASSRFRSRLTLGQTVNRVDQRLQYYSRNPAPKRLQPGVVTAPKVARDAITGDNIVDGSVDGTKITDGSITADQIQAGSITADEIKAGTITAENIAANTITADQINAGAIGSEELKIGAVHAENIFADAIRSEHIFAGAIEAEHIRVGISLNSPNITGGHVDMTGIIRGTRIITNDIIGVGPEDLMDPANYPDGAPQLAVATRISMRPYCANPRTDDNPTGDLTSQLDLYTDGKVNITALSINDFTVNDKMMATKQHRHIDFMAHGQPHSTDSDVRLKKDIQPLSHGLDFINALQPVQYKYINGDGSLVLNEINEAEVNDDGTDKKAFRPGVRTHFGLIAQEVGDLAYEMGLDFGGHVIDGYPEHPDGDQSLRYEEFVAPLIRAVQELSAQVRDLQAQVTHLQGNPYRVIG